MSKTRTGKLEEKIWSNSSLNYFEINDFLKRESRSPKHSWMLTCHCFLHALYCLSFLNCDTSEKKTFFFEIFLETKSNRAAKNE